MWIIPDFLTTTATDKVVCSIVMMSMLQHYFSYKMSLLCGIPSVTLEGDKADLEKIMARINKLPKNGTSSWYRSFLASLLHSTARHGQKTMTSGKRSRTDQVEVVGQLTSLAESPLSVSGKRKG